MIPIEIHPIETLEDNNLATLLRQQLEEELALFDRPLLLTHYQTSDETIDRLIRFWETEPHIQVFCAVIDGKVKGFISVETKPDFYNNRDVISGEVVAVYVAKEYRGRGVGTKLLQYSQEWFTFQNVHSINVSWLIGNEASGNMYKKFGFSPVYCTGRKLLNSDDT